MWEDPANAVGGRWTIQQNQVARTHARTHARTRACMRARTHARSTHARTQVADLGKWKELVDAVLSGSAYDHANVVRPSQHNVNNQCGLAAHTDANTSIHMSIHM